MLLRQQGKLCQKYRSQKRLSDLRSTVKQTIFESCLYMWYEQQFHQCGNRECHEGEKLYIFSSHLGLIRCLTPVRVSAIIYFQAFLDKHRNTTNIILPHKLNHGSRMLSKQP